MAKNSERRELKLQCTPKRVFISYGHDVHASLAIRLRDDLRERGHQLWFDEERLNPGHDWELFIEQGLEHLAADKFNAAMVLLLTPHSVRRPDGYCLNEIARALSRGLRIIPLMVVDSEPPLSICRIQWLDMRKCIPINEKEVFYYPRFTQLLKALEENQLDFEGSQQRLLRQLPPLEFDADILRHVPKFVGRSWVFEAVERWLSCPPKQRVFWISGGPGVGKTAVSAVLSSRYREVAALHLCKFGHAQKSDPRRVVTSIVYQLTTQLTEYEALLGTMDVEQISKDDARTMFDNLLVQPLSKLNQPDRPIIILIDALDEVTSDGRNELASFIAAEFPKTPQWLRLIITSRPEKAVTFPLQALNPFVLDTETEANRSDIRSYLQRELSSLLRARPDAALLLEDILQKSEGVFLYVEQICHDLQQGDLSLDRLEQFPQGLGGVFWQFFERQFPDQEKFRNDVRPALRVVLAACEPLPVEILQRLFSWQDEELHDYLRAIGSLFPVTQNGGTEVIKPYHKTLADWLVDEGKAGPYFMSVIEGHRKLADACWREYEHGVGSMSSYAIVHIAAHLRESSRWQELEAILTDWQFLQAKAEAGYVFELVTDFGEATHALPLGRPWRRIIGLLEEALRRNAHFIAGHPATLFQCLWNSAWWYDCPDAEKHYAAPPNGWKAELPSWRQPGPKVSQVLERWRRERARCGSVKSPAKFLPGGASSVHIPWWRQVTDFLLGFMIVLIWSLIAWSPAPVFLTAFSGLGFAVGWIYTHMHQGSRRMCILKGLAAAALVGGILGGLAFWASLYLARFVGIIGFVVLELSYTEFDGAIRLLLQTQRLRAQECRLRRREHAGGTRWLRALRPPPDRLGNSPAVLTGHGELTCVAISADGQTVAAGTHSDGVLVWDVATGQLISPTLGLEDKTFPSRIMWLGFDVDQTLYIVSESQLLIVDARSGAVVGVRDFPNGTTPFRADATSVGSPRVVLKHCESQALFVDGEESMAPHVTVGYEPALVVAVSANMRRVLLCEWENRESGLVGHLRLWDVDRAEVIAQTDIDDFYSDVERFWLSPEGDWVLARRSCLKKLLVWGPEQGWPIPAWLVHPDGEGDYVQMPFLDQDISRSGLLAAGCPDGTVVVWNLRTRNVLRVLRGHGHAVGCVRFGPDEHTLLSCSVDGLVRVWNLERTSTAYALVSDQLPIEWVGWLMPDSPVCGSVVTVLDAAGVISFDLLTGRASTRMGLERFEFSKIRHQQRQRSGRLRHAIAISETQVIRATGEAVGLVPGDYRESSGYGDGLRSHPNGYFWAGYQADHFYLFQLEYD